MPRSKQKQTANQALAPQDVSASMQLRIAALAAVAALIGALIGAGALYLSTRQQVKAQAEQAREDYFRGQRKDAYSEAVLADNSLYNAEQTYLLQLFPDGLSHPEAVVDEARALSFVEEDELKAGFNVLLEENSRVLLVGSTDVFTTSGRLSTSHKELVDLILSASESPTYESASDTAERAAELAQANAAVVRRRADLLADVRADLGITD